MFPAGRVGTSEEKEREEGEAAGPPSPAEAGPGTPHLERGGHPDVLHEARTATRHISGLCVSDGGGSFVSRDADVAYISPCKECTNQ